MIQRLFALLWVMMLPCAALAQANAPVKFDVVSIRPHEPGDARSGWKWTSTGWEATNITLRNTIAYTRGVKQWLVFGLPPWAESARWDIQAKVTEPDAKPMEKLNADERRELTDSVLRDSFGMVAHSESKQQPVFLMSVTPGSIRFKHSLPPPAGETEPKFGRGTWLVNHGSLEAKYTTMQGLAETLSFQVERTIVDKTGLTGEYDINLKWTPEDRANAGNDNGTGDTPPAIFEALKEQLGLKLTADKAPVPTVVIDKIVQPEAD